MSSPDSLAYTWVLSEAVEIYHDLIKQKVRSDNTQIEEAKQAALYASSSRKSIVSIPKVDPAEREAKARKILDIDSNLELVQAWIQQFTTPQTLNQVLNALMPMIKTTQSKTGEKKSKGIPKTSDEAREILTETENVTLLVLETLYRVFASIAHVPEYYLPPNLLKFQLDDKTGISNTSVLPAAGGAKSKLKVHPHERKMSVRFNETYGSELKNVPDSVIDVCYAHLYHTHPPKLQNIAARVLGILSYGDLGLIVNMFISEQVTNTLFLYHPCSFFLSPKDTVKLYYEKLVCLFW